MIHWIVGQYQLSNVNLSDLNFHENVFSLVTMYIEVRTWSKINEKTASGESLKNHSFDNIFGGVDFLDLCVFSIFIHFCNFNGKYVQYKITNRKSTSELTYKHNLSIIRQFFFQKKACSQMSAFWYPPQFFPSMVSYRSPLLQYFLS